MDDSIKLGDKIPILNENIENIANIMTHVVYKLYLKNVTFNFIEYHAELEESSLDNIPFIINKMKIHAEVIYYMCKKYNNQNILEVFNSLDNTCTFKEELVNYVDMDTDIHKNKYYLHLVKKTNGYLKSKNNLITLKGVC